MKEPSDKKKLRQTITRLLLSHNNFLLHALASLDFIGQDAVVMSTQIIELLVENAGEAEAEGILKSVFRKEMGVYLEKRRDLSSIMRGNSMTTMLFTTYFRILGTPYLKLIFSKLLSDILPSMQTIEIDPKKLDANVDAQANLDRNEAELKRVSVNIINAILDSQLLLPPGIRRLLIFLWGEIEKGIDVAETRPKDPLNILPSTEQAFAVLPIENCLPDSPMDASGAISEQSITSCDPSSARSPSWKNQSPMYTKLSNDHETEKTEKTSYDLLTPNDGTPCQSTSSPGRPPTDVSVVEGKDTKSLKHPSDPAVERGTSSACASQKPSALSSNPLVNNETSRTAQEKVVGTLLFIRFFLPVITSPDTHHIFDDPDMKLVASARRGYIMVGKVLTQIVNQVEFGKKEEHMKSLNPFVLEQGSKIRQYLLDISTKDTKALEFESDLVPEKLVVPRSDENDRKSFMSALWSSLPSMNSPGNNARSPVSPSENNDKLSNSGQRFSSRWSLIKKTPISQRDRVAGSHHTLPNPTNTGLGSSSPVTSLQSVGSNGSTAAVKRRQSKHRIQLVTYEFLRCLSKNMKNLEGDLVEVILRHKDASSEILKDFTSLKDLLGGTPWCDLPDFTKTPLRSTLRNRWSWRKYLPTRVATFSKSTSDLPIVADRNPIDPARDLGFRDETMSANESCPQPGPWNG